MENQITKKTQRLLGQNFLTDERWISKLLHYLPSDAQLVWELGAGSGNITRRLIEQGKMVVAFEVDPHYVELLNKEFAQEITSQKLHIVAGDMMKTWKMQQRPSAIVGNLPFSESTSIIREICLRSVTLPNMVVIVQKEVGDKLTCREGKKNYSPLSVVVQSLFHPLVRDEIPSSAFRPAPHVKAVIIELQSKEVYRNTTWRSVLHSLCTQIFGFRRKMLRNVLKRGRFFHGITGEEVGSALEDAGISLQKRAEVVPVEVWCQLTDLFSEKVIAERGQ